MRRPGEKLDAPTTAQALLDAHPDVIAWRGPRGRITIFPDRQKGSPYVGFHAVVSMVYKRQGPPLRVLSIDGIPDALGERATQLRLPPFGSAEDIEVKQAGDVAQGQLLKLTLGGIGLLADLQGLSPDEQHVLSTLPGGYLKAHDFINTAVPDASTSEVIDRIPVSDLALVTFAVAKQALLAA